MKIAFANDHAGYLQREFALKLLNELGVEVIDHGSDSSDPVDFPVLSRAVCKSVASGEADRGFLLCGTGIGSTMAANRYKSIRAGLCHDTHSAHQGVEHDDMNVLCVGAQIVGPWLMRDIIKAFLGAVFDGTPDVVRRVAMLNEIGEEL